MGFFPKIRPLGQGRHEKVLDEVRNGERGPNLRSETGNRTERVVDIGIDLSTLGDSTPFVDIPECAVHFRAAQADLVIATVQMRLLNPFSFSSR